jgi:hypothetical protein
MSSRSDADSRAALLVRLLDLAVSWAGGGRQPTIVEPASDARVVDALDASWHRATIGPDDSFTSVVQQNLDEGRPVIAVPRWGRIRESSSRLATGDVFRNLEELDLAPCRPSSSASVLLALLPASTLTSSSSQRLRETLMGCWQPSVVVFGTGVMPQTHALFDVGAVLLRARPARDKVIRIFRIPAQPDPVEVARDFVALLKMQGGRKTYGYVLRDGLPPGGSLSYERHDPELLRQRMELAALGKTVPLAQLFEFLPSAVHPVADHNRWPVCATGVRILSGRDIGRDGTIRPSDDDAQRLELPKEKQLQVGDLVMRSIERGTDAGGFAVAQVTVEHLPVAASHTVIAMRPKVSLSAHEVRFVQGFLRTPLAKKLAAEGPGDIRVRRPLLAALDVPQPDETLTATLDDLADAARRMRDWADEAEAILDSALLDEPVIARERLLATGRNLRMRSDAARLLDSFDHGIRTRFPHPLAYRWRKVEAEMSSGDSLRAYEAVLETAEVLHCYAANLILVMARLAGEELRSAERLRSKLTARASGATLGDWNDILEEAGGFATCVTISR